MDSDTFGSVMCALGLFREREKAAPAERGAFADADDDGVAGAGEIIDDHDIGNDDDDSDADAGPGAAAGPSAGPGAGTPWQPPRTPA